MQTLDMIAAFPTVINSTHESMYRSYHILEKVLEMVDRGDSKETIFEVVNFLQSPLKLFQPSPASAMTMKP